MDILIYHARAQALASALRNRVASASIVATSDEAQFRKLLPSTEILIAHTFPVQALESATRLRWIQLALAGSEFLAAARARMGGVVVTNARGIHAAPIADYVMTAAVMLSSDFHGLFREQAAKQWQRRPVRTLAGRTLGIAGLGAIGQEIARRASLAGMTVVGLRKNAGAMDGISRMYGPDALHAFLERCDFVVLAVPLTDATQQMIGAAEFSAMKPGAFIINVARGDVVDEPALVAALATGRIAGACLDVFSVEPLPADSPLWAMPNVIITPHIAGMREDYDECLLDICVDNLQRFASGEPLRNVVDLARGY